MLCIRGDHLAADVPDSPKIREVVGLLRVGLPEACVGVTMNQHAPRERVLRSLVAKLEAGAHFVQTQPVFDVARLEGFLEDLDRRNLRIPINSMTIVVRSGT